MNFGKVPLITASCSTFLKLGTDVNYVNFHKGEKVLSVCEAEVEQEAEEMILQVGRVLTERVYERYASGEITSEQMQKIYRELAKWTKLSEKLLDSATEHSPNDLGKIPR